jgi:ankyrin repeat protein/serine/threonine protein kinase
LLGSIVTEEDIDHEAEAVTTLCTAGHANIVSVLGQDWLETGQHYYIDMELCDINLETYIQNRSSINLPFHNPVFVSEDSGLHVSNLWTIGSHISQGLAFIHERNFSHRDLKPANGCSQCYSKLIIVLYSQAQKAWKIADFGITSKVSISKPAVTTALIRGTAGFRAPELLSEDPKYSNKVDIWALACILYQLCTNTSLFPNDFAVHEFNNSKNLDLQSKVQTSDASQTHISACLQEMLMKDPQSRPSASSLKPLFNLYCVISDPIFSEIPSLSLPYSEWKGLVSASAGNPEDITKIIVDWILSKEGRVANAIEPLLRAPVDKSPRAITLYEYLAELYEEKGDPSADRAMYAQISIVNAIASHKLIKEIWRSSDCSVEEVRSLLENGADPIAQERYFGNALQAAIYYCNKTVVSLLLEKGADMNVQVGQFGNALQAAVYHGKEELVSLFLEKGADVNVQTGEFGNALQAAAHHSNKQIVSMLLDKGADVNAQGGYYGNALQATACHSNKQIVSMLLDKGADVNAQGGRFRNALQAAVSFGKEELVLLFLEKGANVNAQGGYFGNALQAAVWVKNEGLVSLLLEKGADVNAQGGYFGNALQAAVWVRKERLVSLLLEKGANVNAQGGWYENALQAAVRVGNEELVSLLLEKGANVNAQGGCFGNALQVAVRVGNEELVLLLLEKGADVNMQGGHYGNALQAAVQLGKEKLVFLFLEKGADVNAQGRGYKTALEAAMELGLDKIVSILKMKIEQQTALAIAEKAEEL